MLASWNLDKRNSQLLVLGGSASVLGIKANKLASLQIFHHLLKLVRVGVTNKVNIFFLNAIVIQMHIVALSWLLFAAFVITDLVIRQYLLCGSKSIMREEWVHYLFHFTSNVISKSDWLLGFVWKLLLIAIPFNECGVEAHLVFEYFPWRVFMSHTFVMLAQYELIYCGVVSRVLFQVLQNYYCLSWINLLNHFVLELWYFF